MQKLGRRALVVLLGACLCAPARLQYVQRQRIAHGRPLLAYRRQCQQLTWTGWPQHATPMTTGIFQAQ
jgi:hypothetical protein